MRILRSLLLLFVTLLLVVLAYDTVFPPVSTLMVAHRAAGGTVTRHYVPLARISPQLVRAVIAAEDAKFCQHHGVDWQAMRGAVETAVDSGGRGHGASTIPMQTAKNLFLWNGRSYLRKGLELPLALGLDAVWSKRRLMETYLNIAEFGPGLFGAEAAAKRYFGQPAAQLSAYQAAVLASSLPNPKQRNPAQPSPYMLEYAGRTMARMSTVDIRCVR